MRDLQIIYLATVRMPGRRAHSIQIIRTCEALQRLGAKTILIVPKRRKELGENLVSFYGLGVRPTVIKVPTIDLLEKARNKENAYLILVFTFYLFALPLLIILKLSGKTVIYLRERILLLLTWLTKPFHLLPTVYEMHELPKFTGITRKIQKIALHTCKKIVTISKFQEKLLKKTGFPESRITVIHDSVDLDRFKPLRTSINVLRRDFPTRGDVSVGIVGRIEPFKRQMEFLKAAEMVLEKRKNVTFFVIGDVGSKSYFKRLLRFIEERDIKEHVIFTGARDDMVEVLNSLDILITFSGGSVMLEAMACGKPVISVREVLKLVPANLNWQIVRDGETGFVIQRDDIDALVETIVRLIDDPDLRARLGDEGRRWAEERFGREQMIRKTQEVYEGLLKGIDKPARSRIIPS